MKFHFPKLELPDIPQPKAIELSKLAKNNSENPSLLPPKLPPGISIYQNILPRSIDEIISDIENDQSKQISLLEWLYCLDRKEEWDKQNSARSRTSSEAIWKKAKHNSWLRQTLFYRLALYYSGNKLLAPSIADSFSVPKTKKYRLTLEILDILKGDRPGYELAILSWKQLLTPQELLAKVKLPQRISTVSNALNHVAKLFGHASDRSVKKVEWLLRCLDKMSPQQQLENVEHLLINVSGEIDNHPQLVCWLLNNYGINSNNSRWNELSFQAKDVLKKWIKGVNYWYFADLVERILQNKRLSKEQQLRSRKEFWANYSDRFKRIRILLPQKSANILGSYLTHQDVGILVEDDSKPTEVCIFDFGDWFVVEFFRGAGSETRIFQWDADMEKKLFHSSNLSVKLLRCLGGDVHDHVFGWQVFCEKWLREKNIFPNEATDYFRGLSRNNGKYNLHTGLPKLSANKMNKRQNYLNKWRQEIKNLSGKAKQYYHNSPKNP